MEKRFILEIVEGSPAGGRFFIPEGESVIGRHSQSDICIGAEARIVSKKHALLTVLGGSVTVRDCGSKNFTFVNGEKITESAVCEGDILWLGENGPRLRLAREGSESAVKATKATLISAGQGRQGPPEKGTTENGRSADPLSLSGFDQIGLPLMADASGQGGKEPQKGNQVFTTKEVGRMVMRRGEGLKSGTGKNYSHSQEILLSKAAKAVRKNRRMTYGIAGTAIAALLCVCAYYARGYYRYESMIAKSIALKDETKLIDRHYETLRQTDTALSEATQSVLNQLHEKERRLDSIMTLLPARYRQRLFADSTERYLCEIMAEFNEPYYRVPPHMLDLVKNYLTKFTGEQKNQSELIIKRKDQYFPYIERRFRSEQVPAVLAYMAMQESGLDPHARSNKDAVGMWQFVTETGLQYGLRIGPNSDEREDWQKATDAAARYLHDLLAVFGEGRGVLLAIAAYNTGEARIQKALRKIKNPLADRDFWHLYRTSNILASETREYVPQILARIIIDRHHAEYALNTRPDDSNAGR
jgi:pSer/pThr/pTyr-binding forkhead associated (FHA) protein